MFSSLKYINYICLLLLLMSFVSAIDISSDDFECQAFSCGTGWVDDWSYTGSCEITDAYNPIDTYHMRGVSSCIVDRNFDDTGYSEVFVSFYATATSLETVDTCKYYYYDGSSYHLLLTLVNGDDDGNHDYYEFDITSYGTNSNAGIRMVAPTTSGDYCYIDDVDIFGNIDNQLNIFVKDKYLLSSQHNIELTSSITNTVHTLELRDDSDNIFCTEDIISPLSPFTSFYVTCDMPSFRQDDAEAKLYLKDNPSIYNIENFTVVPISQNADEIQIKKVYFSPQVLQGGNTEIYVLIDKSSSITIDDSYITLTFPDNNQRSFSMNPTVNDNEYSAFISDTYLVGNVSFVVTIEGGDYYDTYTNEYLVAGYNVNFVDIVNQVSEVLSVKTVQDINETKIQVHGTEYTATDRGKVFIQLLDGDDSPIDQASCYASIYYPDDSPFKYQQIMTYVDEGLYNYNFDVPYPAGVYMVSSYCYLAGLNATSTMVSDNIESGTISGGSNWDNDWTLNDAQISTASTYEGIYSILISNDDKPERDFVSTISYDSIDVSFWWRATSIEAGEYVYFYLDDASSNEHLLETIADGDDDGVWHHTTVTLKDYIDTFDFDGTLIFRIDTSNNLENGDYVYFDLINLSLNTPALNDSENYQVVRGSGEVHVTTQNGIYTYILEKGVMTHDSFVDDFVFHFNVISQTAVDLEQQPVSLTLYKPFPCDHIYNVTNRLDNNSIVLLDYTTRADDYGRCIVDVVLDLDFTGVYDIEVLAQNYWKKIVWQDYSTLLLEQEMINISCENYIQANNLSDFQIPLVDNVYNDAHDSFWKSCQSYLESSHHYEESVAQFLYLSNIDYNFSYEDMSDLEEQWKHLEDIKYSVEGYANTIFNGLLLGNSYSMGLLADPYSPINPDYVTYFAGISSSYLNYQRSNQMISEIWDYNNRSLNEFDFDVTDESQIWNYYSKNLTYYPSVNISGISVSVNSTAISEQVWSWDGNIVNNILEQFSYDMWEYIGARAEIMT